MMNNKNIFLIVIVFFVNISTLISQKYSWATRANTKAKQLVNNFYSGLNNYCDMDYTLDDRIKFKNDLLNNFLKDQSTIANDLMESGSDFFLAEEYLDNLFAWFPLKSSEFEVSQLKTEDIIPEFKGNYLPVKYTRKFTAVSNLRKHILNTKNMKAIIFFPQNSISNAYIRSIAIITNVEKHDTITKKENEHHDKQEIVKVSKNKIAKKDLLPTKDSLSSTKIINKTQKRTSTSTQSSKSLPETIRRIEDDMVFIPGGTFTMGCKEGDCQIDEKPPHSVRLKSFWIGKYEITQKQWESVMGDSSVTYTEKFKLQNRGIGDDYPIYNISWSDVQLYITKLNKITGKEYRLPTEAEWEYAAKSGSKILPYFYAGSDTIDDVAWYISNSNNKSRPVGQKQPNSIGIYDMTGNVWEWCSDTYSMNYYNISPTQNPQGAISGLKKLYRGGSWGSDKQICRVTNRNFQDIYYKSYYIGFRIVRDNTIE